LDDVDAQPYLRLLVSRLCWGPVFPLLWCFLPPVFNFWSPCQSLGLSRSFVFADWACSHRQTRFTHLLGCLLSTIQHYNEVEGDQFMPYVSFSPIAISFFFQGPLPPFSPLDPTGTPCSSFYVPKDPCVFFSCVLRLLCGMVFAGLTSAPHCWYVPQLGLPDVGVLPCAGPIFPRSMTFPFCVLFSSRGFDACFLYTVEIRIRGSTPPFFFHLFHCGFL